MKFSQGKAEEIKIAYIGGGSRGWAWGLMSDLASCDDISGQVALYDIDFQAAKDNEIIGNKFRTADGAKSDWQYEAIETLPDALSGADFVVISILPGTFDEMESDVHTPENMVSTSRWEIPPARAVFCVPCAPFPCSRKLQRPSRHTVRMHG